MYSINSSIVEGTGCGVTKKRVTSQLAMVEGKKSSGMNDFCCGAFS
jgi:hypothetical protein